MSLDRDLERHIEGQGFSKKDWKRLDAVPEEVMKRHGGVNQQKWIAAYRTTYSMPDEPSSNLEIFECTVSTGLGSAYPQHLEVYARGKAIPFIRRMMYGEDKVQVAEGEEWVMPANHMIKFAKYTPGCWYRKEHCPEVAGLRNRYGLNQNSEAASLLAIYQQMKGRPGKYARIKDWHDHIALAEFMVVRLQRHPHLAKVQQDVIKQFGMEAPFPYDITPICLQKNKAT